VIYATMIVTLTGIVVSAWNSSATRDPHRQPGEVPGLNLPYVLDPAAVARADAQTPSVQPPLLTGRTSRWFVMDTAVMTAAW